MYIASISTDTQKYQLLTMILWAISDSPRSLHLHQEQSEKGLTKGLFRKSSWKIWEILIGLMFTSVKMLTS